MGSVFLRLFSSASAILIVVLVVMGTGTFILLGLQFHASWGEFIHANRVSQLAVSDRVIYEAGDIVRTGRGQLQSTLLAQEDPQASMAAIFARTDGQMERVLRDIPPDLIHAISAGIAAAVEEQGTATAEIAHTIERTAVGTQAVTTSITKVSRSVCETGAAAGQVLVSAGEVSQQSDQMSREVDAFVAGIRAA